jgi:hypothetical protein
MNIFQQTNIPFQVSLNVAGVPFGWRDWVVMHAGIETQESSFFPPFKNSAGDIQFL